MYWKLWNIYQHLPHKWASFVGKYIIHGASGFLYDMVPCFLDIPWFPYWYPTFLIDFVGQLQWVSVFYTSVYLSFFNSAGLGHASANRSLEALDCCMSVHHRIPPQQPGSEELAVPRNKALIKKNTHRAVCQNLVPLVKIKIAGKWMFISLKMVLIGIDPYPYCS